MIFYISSDSRVIYEQINSHFHNFLSEGVYNAISILNCDKYIFEDKLDKGIVVERVIKSKDGIIIDYEYDEYPTIYDMIYGNN
jgi:hypothetical protein